MTGGERPEAGPKGGEPRTGRDQPGADPASRNQGGRQPVWPFVAVALIVCACVGYLAYAILRPRPDVWTDDAYVRVHYAKLSPRVAGRVQTVEAEDNQPVRAGRALVTIDPRDFQTAVASSQAALARDSARVGDTGGMIERQPALIDEQKAALATAEAGLQLAQANAKRYNNLAATGAGTVQERQQANSALQAAGAARQSAEAGLRAATRQLDVLRAQKRAAEGTVALDEAQLEQARLNLSYTRIVAPIDGVVGEKSVQVGDYVTPGATLMVVAPLQQSYVEANYREVDLRHMRAGQKATIHVDAYDVELDGIVDSLPPASGASFAPIAPNNATGNFTKIVQRLPVKIVLAPGQRLADLLKVGFSVEATVHTGLEDVVAQARGTPPPGPGR